MHYSTFKIHMMQNSLVKKKMLVGFLSMKFLGLVEVALTRTVMEIPTKGLIHENDEKQSNNYVLKVNI